MSNQKIKCKQSILYWIEVSKIKCLVSNHTGSLNELSKEDLNQAKELVEKSNKVSEEVNKLQEDTSDSIDKKQDDIRDLIKSASTKCNAFNNDINEVGKNVEKVVRTHVVQSVEALEDSSASSVKKFETHAKLQAEQIFPGGHPSKY